jgi:hypothetical protein
MRPGLALGGLEPVETRRTASLASPAACVPAWPAGLDAWIGPDALGYTNDTINWHEQDASDRSARVADPGAKLPGSRWQCRSEHTVVLPNPPAVGGVGEEDEHASQARRPPPETLPGDRGCQAGLIIKLVQCRLDGGDLRLVLDHQEGACARMPSENVDRSSLAVARIGNLGLGNPTSRTDRIHRCRRECRVAGIDEPIQRRTAPAQVDADRGVERASDRTQTRHPDVVDASELDERDE